MSDYNIVTLFSEILHQLELKLQENLNPRKLTWNPTIKLERSYPFSIWGVILKVVSALHLQKCLIVPNRAEVDVDVIAFRPRFHLFFFRLQHAANRIDVVCGNKTTDRGSMRIRIKGWRFVCNKRLEKNISCGRGSLGGLFFCSH